MCDDYSQVSFMKTGLEEPESVDFTGLEFKYRIPTVVGKTLGKDEWYAGDEALKGEKLGEACVVRNLFRLSLDKNPVVVDDVTVMPIELISKYLDYLIQAARTAGNAEKVDSVCITFADYNISMLNMVAGALQMLGYSEDEYTFSSHDESFIYFSMSQKNELWKNDVFLFDYTLEGMVVKRMYITGNFGQRLAMVHTDDYTNELPYDLAINNLSSEYLDNRLSGIAAALFEKKNISTVYLTGMGFDGEFDLPAFVKCICDRKRAFVEPNLYCRGACFEAMEQCGLVSLKDVMLACPNRVTTGIEMKISDRGRDKILRMVRPGVNWYFADCSFDFIVDEARELEIFISPLDGTEKQVVRIPIGEFADRPGKTTRINVNFSFTSDSRCHLMVKDLGFGEFFASSGIVINEELLL